MGFTSRNVRSHEMPFNMVRIVNTGQIKGPLIEYRSEDKVRTPVYLCLRELLTPQELNRVVINLYTVE